MADSNEFTIVWKGSPNKWKNRGFKKVAICNHIMQGSIESANSHFQNEKAEASTQFGVARDGRIWQWGSLDEVTWGNGSVGLPDTSIPWIAQAVNNRTNFNDLTVSIEHEGLSGQELTPIQYQATLWLHKKIFSDLKLPLDNPLWRIVGHYQLDKINKPFCPGKGFPFEQLRADLVTWDKAGRPSFNGEVIQPEFNPNPGGFAIGPGVAYSLKQLHLKAATGEQYYIPEPGQILKKISLAWGEDGTMFVTWLQENGTGETHAFREVRIPE